LILQSASEVDTLPFAYIRHALKDGMKPDWDSIHRILAFRSETGETGAADALIESRVLSRKFLHECQGLFEMETNLNNRKEIHALHRN
jgi:hypothetical protein